MDKEYFRHTLSMYSKESNPEKLKQLENDIWDRFGESKTVVIIDMSGFSLLVQRHGVVHYLSMIKCMQSTARPIIESYGGDVVKFEADNCFAVFNEPLAGIEACISLNRVFDEANTLISGDRHIRISCGIDCGNILLIESSDLFGNPVNQASKLGEDIANPGQILVTKSAIDLVPKQSGINYEEMRFNISGIEILACVIQYQ